METLFLLLPISFVLMLAAGGAFVWAVASRQFDDLEKHALDVLDEDP